VLSHEEKSLAEFLKLFKKCSVRLKGDGLSCDVDGCIDYFHDKASVALWIIDIPFKVFLDADIAGIDQVVVFVLSSVDIYKHFPHASSPSCSWSLWIAT
jgi:hypothetical protein